MAPARHISARDAARERTKPALAHVKDARICVSHIRVALRAMSGAGASASASRVSNLTQLTALSMVVIPLGIVAHVVAMCALPLELLATYAREMTGSKGGELKALVVALWGLALAPTATRLATSDARSDARVIKSLTERHAATVEALRAENEECESKFIAACKRLKEDERIRERLRKELREAREAVVGPELAAGGGGGSMFFVTAVALGTILLYFHDITEVKHVDKKLAMWVPVAWLLVLSAGKPANVVKLVTAANLVLSGYFLHIVLDHKRLLGTVAHTIIG
jgi:hypothetical protein